MSTAIKNVNKTQHQPQQNGTTAKTNGTAAVNGHGTDVTMNGNAKKVGVPNGITNGVATAAKKVDPKQVTKPAPPPSANAKTDASRAVRNNRNSNEAIEHPVKADAIKFTEAENAAIKLADIHMSDISVVNVYKTDKDSPCKTRIVIYRPKDPTKKPTAKVVVEKVVKCGCFFSVISVVVFFLDVFPCDKNTFHLHSTLFFSYL